MVYKHHIFRCVITECNVGPFFAAWLAEPSRQRSGPRASTATTITFVRPSIFFHHISKQYSLHSLVAWVVGWIAPRPKVEMAAACLDMYRISIATWLNNSVMCRSIHRWTGPIEMLFLWLRKWPYRIWQPRPDVAGLANTETLRSITAQCSKSRLLLQCAFALRLCSSLRPLKSFNLWRNVRLWRVSIYPETRHKSREEYAWLLGDGQTEVGGVPSPTLTRRRAAPAPPNLTWPARSFLWTFYAVGGTS